MISTILLSGGVGSRMGRDTPKQYCELQGKKVIEHCLDAIVLAGYTDELVVVYGEGYYDFLHGILKEYRELFNVVKIILGGNTRQESVFRGLNSSSHKNVLLHEAARPLVTPRDLKMVVENSSDAVTMGLDIPFTVLKSKNGYITEVLKRDELFNVQLPQKFNRALLIEAHKKAQINKRHFTDDSSLYFTYCGMVAVIKGSTENIKITTLEDFSIAEKILMSRC